jgi:uncharacterized protein
MATGIRKAGEFCWINMLTPRPAEARGFFGKLLGWTYMEMPGNMGHVVRVGGRDIGGLFDLAGPQTPPGTPPHIGVMIKVDNADATCAKVTSLGGRAKPPFDVMGNLRMAECFDPAGAEFDIWRPKNAHGTDVDDRLPGAASWFETMTTDAPRAAKFYSDLFGWTHEKAPNSPVDYTVFQREGMPIAGMLPITPEMGKMPAQWLTYFTVTNAEQAASEAVKLGGKICMTMKEAHGVCRFCSMTSPQGVMFYVVEYVR